MNRNRLKQLGYRKTHLGRYDAPHSASFQISPASESGFDLRKLLARQILPLGFAIAIMALLWDQLDGLDFAYIKSSLQTVQPHQWALAALLSAVSFWAVGRYDRVVHRMIGTATRSRAAQLSGVTAIALSQTVGFGVISSALVRWRMLPEVSLLQALRISMIVAMSFLSAWAVVTAIALLLTPLELPGAHWIGWISWMALAGAALFVTLSIWRPHPLSRFTIPSLQAMTAFVGLAALDTIAAGGALWAVLPENCDIALLPLLTAYLVALGAGLISGTPGGVGPFEVTLLALLPHLDQEPVLAAILAFRAIYYAIPALIAAVVTLRGPRTTTDQSIANRRAQLIPVAQPSQLSPTMTNAISQAIANAPRAEAALLRQGTLSAFNTGARHVVGMGKLSGQSLILLSDPFSGRLMQSDHLDRAKILARHALRKPFLYKIGPRFAVAARRAGWKTLPIAKEAWLTPAGFSTDGSSRRQLRRKLRQAQKAGVSISLAGSALPLDEMDRIARCWRDQRGGERGFSMGIWNPATLPHAQVFLAHRNGQLIGFITLHKNPQEQVLDLMRLQKDAPDGTMHLLVHAAIERAAIEGCPRLSLAAVPLGKQDHEPMLFHMLRDRLDRTSGAAGLRQFKTSFAPRWETLYAAAPSRFALTLGALDVLREIAHPQLPPDKAQADAPGSSFPP